MSEMGYNANAASGDTNTLANWFNFTTGAGAAALPASGDSVYVGPRGNSGSSITAATAASGATSITLTGTSISLVAGAVIRIAGSGMHICRTARSGNGAVSISPALRAAITGPIAVTYVNGADEVTHNIATATWGDDTTATNSGANGSGTIGFSTKFTWSRSVSTALTFRGTAFVMGGVGAQWNMGTEADPITAVTHTVTLNASASVVNGKHWLQFGTSTAGIRWGSVAGDLWTAVGVRRARASRITANIAIAATSATVADVTGWAVGDTVRFMATDANGQSTNSHAGVESKTIATVTPGTGTTGTITWSGGLTFEHSDQGYIYNTFSNLKLTCVNAAQSTSVHHEIEAAAAANTVYLRDLNIEAVGINSSESTNYGGFGFNWQGTPTQLGVLRMQDCPLTVIQGNGGLQLYSGPGNNAQFDRCTFGASNGQGAMSLRNGYSGAVFNDCHSYHGSLLNASNGFGDGGSTFNRWIHSGGGTLVPIMAAINGNGSTFNDCVLMSGQFAVQTGSLVNITLNRCYIGVTHPIYGGGTNVTATKHIQTQTPFTLPAIKFNDCVFDRPLDLSAQTTNMNADYTQCYVRDLDHNADPTQQGAFIKTGQVYRDNSQLIRSRSSIRFEPLIASTPHAYQFTAGATSGISTVFRFGLRYDSTYTNGTPPSVTVSGLGITPQTFTAGGTVNTDYQGTITVTPTSTGNLTVTVSGQSTAITGKFWFSGMSSSPWIDWTQHYGYAYNPGAPTLTVDPVVQLSESAAAALTGLAYSSGTLTLTSTHTIREIYDWLKWYEASNYLDPIITSGDGVSFTLAANLTQSGGDITGTGRLTLTTGKTHTPNSNTSDVIISSDAGTTAVLTLSVPVTSAVVVYKQTGARDSYTASSGTTVTVRVPAGVTGAYTYKVAKYGQLPATGSTTVTGGGYLAASVATTSDPGITQPTVATVAAYTTLDTLDKFYDYAAYFETLTGGIDYVRPTSKAGAALDMGSRALAIDATAGSVYVYAGAGVTIKAAALADGVTFTSLTTSGAVTYLNGATFNTIITSSAGTTGKLMLTGLSSHNIYVQNATPSQVDYQIGVSSYTLWVAAGSTGVWRWRAVKYGNLPETGTFTATGGGRFTATLANVADTSISQPTLATVLAYTTLGTWDKVYDYCQAYLTTTAGKALGQVAVKNGSAVDLGSYNLTVDASAGTVFVLSGGITIKATNLVAGTNFQGMLTTSTIVTVNGARVDTWYTTSAGRSVLVLAPNIISGSRYQVWNTTGSAELFNAVCGSGGVYERTTWTGDITVRLRATYQSGVTAKHEVQVSAILTSTGTTFLDSQVNEDVYNANGIDGSTCTEFSDDYPHVQIDISDPDGVTTVQRLYAWYHYTITTANGIRNFFEAMSAGDIANYEIDQSVVDLRLDNMSGLPVVIGGGYLRRKDSTTVIAPTSGSIQMDPSKAYVAGTGDIAAAVWLSAQGKSVVNNTGLIPALL